MTPEEIAAKVVAELERRGVPPFEDCGWMNPEDRDAVRAPIADAVRAAVAAERERLAALAALRSDQCEAEAERAQSPSEESGWKFAADLFDAFAARIREGNP